jgi:hypothetical protein
MKAQKERGWSMPVIDFDSHFELRPHGLDDLPALRERLPESHLTDDTREATSDLKGQPSFPSSPPNASEQGDTHG